MIIVSEETIENKIMDYIPKKIRKYLYCTDIENAEEIHIRKNMPVTVKTGGRQYILTKKGQLSFVSDNAVFADERDISDAVMLICENSFYSFSDKMANGYVTVDGGHRVGIAGSISSSGGKKIISDISGLNYRIAKEFKGISDKAADEIYSGGNVKSTVIVSPPGCGKTTLLRDLVRNLSYRGTAISVIDERHELFSMYHGVPCFDSGPYTDILDNCPKREGMEKALRTLAPDVIATDEIGLGEHDILKYILKCGVGVIATAHGSAEENSGVLSLFEKIVYLDKNHNITVSDNEERSSDL